MYNAYADGYSRGYRAAKAGKANPTEEKWGNSGEYIKGMRDGYRAFMTAQACKKYNQQCKVVKQ